MISPGGHVERLAAGVTVALAALGGGMAVGAADPQLDASFDDDGRQFTNVATGNLQSATGLAIQDDNKILLVGYTAECGACTSTHDAAVVRYEADGDPDTSFGGDGSRLYDNAIGGWNLATAAAIDADDSIVVAGGAETEVGSGSAFTAMKLDAADGDLDQGFGEQGVASVDVDADVESHSLNQAVALAIQGDGKIVLVGSGTLELAENEFTHTMTITRVEADGDLDTVFGDGGVTKVAFPGAQLLTTGDGVAIDSAGRIVAVGLFADAENNPEFAVVRLEPDGDLDPTFSGDGMTTTDYKQGSAQAVVIDDADRPVVVGSVRTGPCCSLGLALARYTTGGALDPAFGDDGIASSSGFVFGEALALEDDGDLVAAGSAGSETVGATRYSPDGELVSSKKLIHALPPGEEGFADVHAVGVDSSGKVVLGGEAHGGETEGFAAIRLTSLGTPPPTTRIEGLSVNANKDKAKVRFTGATLDPPISFECRLDRKRYTSCTSPKTYKDLSERRHTVRVVAIDGSGDSDRTPAKKGFRVR